MVTLNIKKHFGGYIISGYSHKAGSFRVFCECMHEVEAFVKEVS